MQRENACALPGVDIKYDNFMTCMWRAVDRGYVRREHAEFCAEGLRHGFTCGIDATQLRGHRYHRNYPTATEHRKAVTNAIRKRVDAGKTLELGTWDGAMRDQLRVEFTDCIKFPLGRSHTLSGGRRRSGGAVITTVTTTVITVVITKKNLVVTTVITIVITTVITTVITIVITKARP